jgi:cytochrome c5
MKGRVGDSPSIRERRARAARCMRVGVDEPARELHSRASFSLVFALPIVSLAVVGCGRVPGVGEARSIDPWDVVPDDPALARGRAVWLEACKTCHASGLGGAPIFGDRDAWRSRRDRGAEALVERAIHGFWGDVGEMPARGGNADLSDDDVRSAVQYLLSGLGSD